MSQYSSILSPICVDAVLRVIDPARDTNVDLRDIKIIQKLGSVTLHSALQLSLHCCQNETCLRTCWAIIYCISLSSALSFICCGTAFVNEPLVQAERLSRYMTFVHTDDIVDPFKSSDAEWLDFKLFRAILV